LKQSLFIHPAKWICTLFTAIQPESWSSSRYQLGDSNAVIRTLFSHLPADKHKEHTFSNVQIDLTHLLPADRGYYTFPGSLTTPPCTENVTWFVLKQTLNLASEEIERFCQRYPNNARPTQPLHDRIVLQSK